MKINIDGKEVETYVLEPQEDSEEEGENLEELEVARTIRGMKPTEIFENLSQIATADIGNYALDLIFTIGDEEMMIKDAEAPNYFLP